MKNKYKIEHKILTLAHCAVMDNKDKPASFNVDGVKFSHWDFNYRDGWRNSDAWIATTEVVADNYVDAINILGKKLSKIIPRISLISQSYIEYLFEPFVVHKIGSDVVFFRYIKDVEGGGLMFMEKELKALNGLLLAEKIPETFYYYWNDAVNTVGYSSKLLIMFSALEALAKNRDKKKFKKPIDLYSEILGKELSSKIFSDGNGLRNRLIHGEYFGDEDQGKEYIKIIHDKVISYFNNKILSESLIQEDIVHPQRHPFGNKKAGIFFLKCKNGTQLFRLKDILNDFSGEWAHNLKNYEQVSGADLSNTY
ncbi:MAG: hypothetical protein ABIG87_01660 [Patescibacteria group bacterium]